MHRLGLQSSWVCLSFSCYSFGRAHDALLSVKSSRWSWTSDCRTCTLEHANNGEVGGESFSLTRYFSTWENTLFFFLRLASIALCNLNWYLGRRQLSLGESTEFLNWCLARSLGVIHSLTPVSPSRVLYVSIHLSIMTPAGNIQWNWLSSKHAERIVHILHRRGKERYYLPQFLSDPEVQVAHLIPC